MLQKAWNLCQNLFKAFVVQSNQISSSPKIEILHRNQFFNLKLTNLHKSPTRNQFTEIKKITESQPINGQCFSSELHRTYTRFYQYLLTHHLMFLCAVYDAPNSTHNFFFFFSSSSSLSLFLSHSFPCFSFPLYMKTHQINSMERRKFFYDRNNRSSPLINKPTEPQTRPRPGPAHPIQWSFFFFFFWHLDFLPFSLPPSWVNVCNYFSCFLLNNIFMSRTYRIFLSRDFFLLLWFPKVCRKMFEHFSRCDHK